MTPDAPGNVLLLVAVLALIAGAIVDFLRVATRNFRQAVRDASVATGIVDAPVRGGPKRQE